MISIIWFNVFFILFFHCIDMCIFIVHLMFQLEEPIIEEFDGVLPKSSMVNWENVLNSTYVLEYW